MTQNNNFSPLPWYSSIDEQNHRKSYAYGNVYPLFTPKDKLLGFQIIRETSDNEITEAKLYTKEGIFVADILSNMNDTGLEIVKFVPNGYDVIIYPGTLPLIINTGMGQFYIVMSDSVNTWYSEVFTVVMDISNYTLIEWYDVEDLEFDAGRIVYKNPTFKNRLYFKNEIGKPEYEFNEEGEDRDGYFFPEKQISEKTYKMVILAPEFLCDIMRFIRMADIVVLRDKYKRVYKCDTFLITPKWETQGDLASVEIEFQTNTVVKKVGKGFIIGDSGDFNNDFDNDFDIDVTAEYKLTPPNDTNLLIENNGVLTTNTNVHYYKFDNNLNYTQVRYVGHKGIGDPPPNDIYSSILAESSTGVFTEILKSGDYTLPNPSIDAIFSIPVDTKFIHFNWSNYNTEANSILQLTFNH